ncbi:hypothetical protein OS493_006268 [Desmophyllum pertusum]|uniref:VWFA domain-containing protein n=1 Tax=Desmophyllum pertusum TaxID=174260 RepID=A0A9X0DCS4_9CNID|nr:hypothetical protein OS493_006268 [Desmophyllum pertusum]
MHINSNISRDGPCVCLSANSESADAAFTLMTDTVRKIIRNFGFGNGNIQYGVIVYGATVEVKVQLGDPSFKNIEDLREYIQKLPKQTSDPQIDKALQEALKIFQGPNARPGAKQVLVVLTDKKSTSSEEVIKTSARLLEERQIRVIPVGVGSETDPDELRSITPYKDDVIKANEEPWRLAREIIIKILTGTRDLCCPEG